MVSYDYAEIVSLLLHNKAQVVSLESGQFFVAKEQRGLMCLVRIEQNKQLEHVLFILGSATLDPFVLAYKDSISRQQIDYQILTTGIKDILDLYELKRQGQLQDDSESEVQKYVIRLIRRATENSVSDIHIVVKSTYCDIYFRANGYLELVEQIQADAGIRLCSTIYQSMCDVAEPTFRQLSAQGARMKEEYIHECGLSGSRINTRPLDRGMMMVLRLLYADSKDNFLTLEQLGYLPEQCQILESLIEHRTGMVLLSGPTGSGKSTTLKVVMQQILATNKGIHLFTLEDPPEYEIIGANQSPVSSERKDSQQTEYTWANAIADAMRLDPDVIMIGEIRDSTTAKMAFRAAMTGHLIWSTVHANDALGILPRLEDEGVRLSLVTDPFLVVGLVNQSLVPVLCPNCKIPLPGNEQQVSERLLSRLASHCQIAKVALQGPGCEQCRQRGVVGRTVVAEVIQTTAEMLRIYKEQGHEAANSYCLGNEHFLTKTAALIRKIDAGLIDPRAGERVIGPINL